MKILRFIQISVVSCLTAAYASCAKDGYTIPAGSDTDFSGQAEPSKVEVKQTDGKWQLICNGEPMYINGAATNRYYAEVAKFGGNAFRTYSVNDETKAILDEAYENGLFVNLGIYIGRETDGFDYNDETKVAEQLQKARASVEQYKNHPAVLMWSIGNEAEASHKNLKLWTAINDIAKMIHEVDPNHPTTTALAGANPTNIKHVIELAPEIDLISINSYAPVLPNVYNNVKTAGWKKPWMITEFGPRGTWQMNPEPDRILPWGDPAALVEQTSTEKEAVYLEAWQKNIKPQEANGCIGSFVFVWGYQSHGEVLNWYGLFDKNKYSYGAVDAMQYCWTGKYPEIRAPRIESREDMTMNGKIADDAIRVAPSSENTAKVTATAQDGVTLTYHWLIYREGDAAEDGSMPDGIEGLIEDPTKSEISFKAPAGVGGYRMYVFAKDDVNRKVASACIPFCVE